MKKTIEAPYITPFQMLSAMSYRRFILYGLLMIILSFSFILLIFFHFYDQLKVVKFYSRDTCISSQVSLLEVEVENVDSASKSVSMCFTTCIQALVNTTNYTNIMFYRNNYEKEVSIHLGTKCSYIPLPLCKHDAKYTEKYLKAFVNRIFPPINFEFKCFVQNTSSSDALLFIPQKWTFNLMIGILSFGIFLGIIIIFYGLMLSDLKYRRPSYKQHLKGINMVQYDEKFLDLVKKVLESVHINSDNMIIQTEDDLNEQEDLKEKNFLKNECDYDKDDDVWSCASFDSNIINIHRLRKRPSKIRVGDSEYHVGRIEYKRPSSSTRLSKNGSSLTLHTNDSRLSLHHHHSHHPANFFIGQSTSGSLVDQEGTYEEANKSEYSFDIPAAILEEDEKSNFSKRNSINPLSI